MKTRTKNVVLVVGVAVAMGALFLLPVLAERQTRIEPREIVIVARDMAFFLEGSAEPNPIIRVTPGEQILLTLRNEDVGITHDLVIDKWGAATRALRGAESDRLAFTVPDKPGSVEYVCRPHSTMMRGMLRIE